MITRENINVAIGTRIDFALTAAGLPTERRKPDDEAPVDRRSLQIVLEELTVDPMGDYRRCDQTIRVYFYPSNKEQYRDEVWSAVNALETSLISPLIVDGAELYLGDDGIVADMTGEVLEITFLLSWIEIKGDDSDLNVMETLELEMNMEEMDYVFNARN